MDKVTRLSVQQRADLVAYLDGELDDSETRSIEETLAKSPAARRDVEMLSRAWDMLDLLPRLDPGEEFTQQTISRLRAVEQGKQATTAKLGVWTRRCLVAAIWMAGLATAILCGIFTAVQTLPNEGQQMIDDFPVVEKLDLYESVGSLEFLEELERRDLFENTEAENE